jgi:hypothetical protein
MADIPDRIVLKRHRDLEGLGGRIWYRRGLLTLLVAFLCLGLANVFGQRPHGTTVEVADENEAKKILRLMDQLEDNDDVQDVYANFDIPEVVLEAVAS